MRGAYHQYIKSKGCCCKNKAALDAEACELERAKATNTSKEVVNTPWDEPPLPPGCPEVD